VREIIGTLLVLAGLVALVIAAIAALVALYQLVKGRRDPAEKAGAAAVAGILAVVAGVGIGGAILPPPLTTAPQDAARVSETTEEAMSREPTTEPPARPESEVLDANGVVAELEDRGLSCTDLGEDLTRCEQGNPTPGSHGYMVMVTPGYSGSVERIQANVFGYTPEDAGFLGEIAALKIRKGVDTEAARRWVMAHAEGAVTNPASKKFGGLGYSIEGGAIEGGGETRILIVEEAWY
jgi:hypothetical protein